MTTSILSLPPLKHPNPVIPQNQKFNHITYYADFSKHEKIISKIRNCKGHTAIAGRGKIFQKSKGVSGSKTKTLKYNGEWAESRPHGAGTWHYGNGERYTGEWVKGVKCGRGTFWQVDGSVYKGQFEGDRMEGVGENVWEDGSFYNGEFRDSKICGHGSYYYDSGEIFEGCWEDNVREGKGMMIFKDGWRYVGEWTGGQASGLGRLFCHNSLVYESEWIQEEEGCGDGEDKGKHYRNYSFGYSTVEDLDDGPMKSLVFDMPLKENGVKFTGKVFGGTAATPKKGYLEFNDGQQVFIRLEGHGR